MNIRVRNIDEIDLEGLEVFGLSIPEEDRCALTGETSPTLFTIQNQMTNGTAFVAVDHEIVKGFTMFRDDGTIKWLVIPNNSEFPEVAKALIDAVVEKCGACQGVVSNSDVRAKIVALGYREDEGGWIYHA